MITKSQNIRRTNLLEGIKIGMHDIRSPITFLRILQDSATNLSPQEKNLLESATRRIVGVVDSMDKLLHNGFENDCEFNNVEPLNLSITIEKILLEKKYEYKDFSITFFYTPPAYAADCLITSEIDDLERMLSNLLNNAVEACNENGIITVTLELKDEVLYLSIFDNGKGIPDDILQKLRDGINVTSGKENGHGIGFNQIRNTVAKLGGSIIINSILGRGSTLQIVFPVAIDF